MSFASAVKSIGKGIKDLSQLNVRTYTGTINANVDGDDAEAMLQTARAAGTLELVGITTINLDGDVNQFITNSDKITDKLHAAHFTAVQQSQKSRQAALDMFAGAISSAMSDVKIDPNQD